MTHGVADRLPRRTRARWVPIAVVATIAVAVLIPTLLLRGGADPLEPARLPGRIEPAARIPVAATVPKEAANAVHTLVLYDRTGRWGWLGELYAVMAGNLASHFGRWTSKPVTAYRPGDIARHTATIYLGSTYGEPLPAPFLSDVAVARRPVIWAGANIHELARRNPDLATRQGWKPGLLDRSPVREIRYKGTALTRWSRRTVGLMTYAKLDRSRVAVVAKAVRSDGSTLPWAIRSGRLTYVGEIPFAYSSETDRVLVFADLLFDALAPRTRPRHRALVRLEDINPLSEPEELRAAADYLHSKGIPFGFGVSPRYRDPTGGENGGEPKDVLLRDTPEVADTIRYLEQRGGVLVGHGYTHQWDGGNNPYDGATGDDVEFFRVVERRDKTLDYRGPVPGDSVAWAERRIAFASREFEAAGIAPPKIFEFPHYAASLNAYRAAARRFSTRWERAFYFPGLLSAHAPTRARPASQFFPYVVRDVYGTKVLPESLGSVNPEAWHGYPARRPADIVEAARAQLVVRDNVAGFFFHPFLDLSLLRRTIDGLRALGYEFVSPNSL